MIPETDPALPRVEAFHALDALGQHLPAIAALNRAARRPSPFLTPQYLAASLAHDERPMPGVDPLLLVAFDRPDQPVGFLPLRKRPERIWGLPCTRVEFLTTHDTGRPGLVAKAADGPRCADAFVQHLARVDKSWSYLELMEQDVSSPLYAPPLDPHRFTVRRHPSHPSSTLALDGDFEGWFTLLEKSFKSDIGRSARMLWATGGLELLVSDNPGAAGAMLDLYLELETRSWKSAAQAGIARHPERVELFRTVLSQGGETRPLFLFLVLDGVTIAGTVGLEFAGTVYELEVAFDSAWSAFSPSNVLFLLAVRELFARGISTWHLLGDFPALPRAWAATVTETHAVQVYRKGTIGQVRAVAGELGRRLFQPRRPPAPGHPNLSPRSAPAPAPLRGHSRALAVEIFEELAQRHLLIDRLGGEALAAAFPFPIRGAPHA